MAKVNSTKLGMLSGKLGQTVYYITPDGMQHCRVLTTPKDPQSPAQLAQRARFTIANKVLNPLLKIIRQGYGNAPHIFQKVVGLVMKEAIEGEYPDFLFDYGKVPLCRGTLSLPAHAAMTYQPATREAQFSWEEPTATPDYKGSPNDIAHIIVLHAGSFPEAHTLLAGNRRDGSYRYTLPDHWQAEQTHFWLHLLSHDLMQQSDSLYLGRAMP